MLDARSYAWRFTSLQKQLRIGGRDREMKGIEGKGKLVFLLSLFALFSIFDLYVTSAAISLGAQEMNPLLSHVNGIGITFFDVVRKAGYILLICFTTFYAHKMALETKSNSLVITIYAILVAFNIIFLIVVANNVNCFLSLQK